MERFWKKIDKRSPDECWEWTAAQSNGYGRIYFSGKYDGAHRVSLMLAGIDVPPDACVCHKCDNKLCVNPAHLFVGTQSDNIKDMYEKGRGSFENQPRGESHGRSKLTEESVKRIRGCDGLLTRDSIARMFGVSVPTVADIINRRKWKHVQ